MKTKSKALILAICAILLLSVSVFGTMAYLTDEKAVTNTFTVGDVEITLDEIDVDEYGVEVDNAQRIEEGQEYLLIPGRTYTKDPTVHVIADSEACYVYVKVINGIAAYESDAQGYTSIAGQIAANGWTALDGVANVYWKAVDKSDAVQDLPVFAEFQVDATANKVSGWDTIAASTNDVVVTAYAIQQDGFVDAKAAWDAAVGTGEIVA